MSENDEETESVGEKRISYKNVIIKGIIDYVEKQNENTPITFNSLIREKDSTTERYD